MPRRDYANFIVAILITACIALTTALAVVLQTGGNSVQSTTKPSIASRAWAAISQGNAAIKSCNFDYGVSRSGGYDYRFHAVVTNNSGSAIDELIFYVRARDTDRTVPLGESLEVKEIPGGIEPGETLELTFHVAFINFGNYDYPQPPKAPFEVGIVDEYPTDSRKLYQQFANVSMLPVAGDYTRNLRTGEDGFMRDLMNIEVP